MTPFVRPETLPYRDPKDPSIRGIAVAGYGHICLSEMPWHLRHGRSEGDMTCVKSSRKRRVIRFEQNGNGLGPKVLMAKRYLSRSLINAAIHRVWPSKTRSEWHIGWKAMERGILTGRPVLMAEQIENGVLRACHLVTEHIDAEHSLLDQLTLMADREEDPGDLMDAVAEFLKSMHEMKFYHDDLRPEHIWIDPRGETLRFGLIDLDHSSFRPFFIREWREANLFQLLRFTPIEILGQEDRLRFLGHFNGDDLIQRLEARAAKKGTPVHLR